MSKLWRFLKAPRADARWDRLLRATGAVGLLGIPLTLHFPAALPLVWLAVVGLAANSPLSPVLPTFFEPVIMEAAKHSHVLAVSTVALAVCLYSEYLNWYVYRWVLGWEALATLLDRRWVQRSVALFGRWPFTTVVVFALTPMPFWVARCLAVLYSYPVRSYLTATALGRFPRYFAYAVLGDILQVPTVWLFCVVVGGALIPVTWSYFRRSRVIRDRPPRAHPPGTDGARRGAR